MKIKEELYLNTRHPTKKDDYKRQRIYSDNQGPFKILTVKCKYVYVSESHYWMLQIREEEI